VNIVTGFICYTVTMDDDKRNANRPALSSGMAPHDY